MGLPGPPGMPGPPGKPVSHDTANAVPLPSRRLFSNNCMCTPLLKDNNLPMIAGFNLFMEMLTIPHYIYSCGTSS